jgi:hypothetical protein
MSACSLPQSSHPHRTAGSQPSSRRAVFSNCQATRTALESLERCTTRDLIILFTSDYERSALRPQVAPSWTPSQEDTAKRAVLFASQTRSRGV